MKATRIIGLLVAVFMATALFGGVVYAEPPDEEPPYGDGERTQVIEHSDPDSPAQSTGWTCEHDVHYPHNSGHEPGRINVTGETTCNVTMNNIIVTVELHQKKCLWIFYVWDVVDVTNPPEEGTSTLRPMPTSPVNPGHIAVESTLPSSGPLGSRRSCTGLVGRGHSAATDSDLGSRGT